MIQEKSIEEKTIFMNKTIGKVRDLLKKCSNFFDWDFCNTNCPMYDECDKIEVVQDAERVRK